MLLFLDVLYLFILNQKVQTEIAGCLTQAPVGFARVNKFMNSLM